MEIDKYTEETDLKDKGVYMITHQDTCLIYIGSTFQKLGFAGRWRQHLLSIKKGTGNVVLCNIYKKYGLNGFKFSILERMNKSSEKEIREREAYYINKYNSYHLGANVSLSTDCSFRLMKHFPNTPEKCMMYKEKCTTKKPLYVYNGKGDLVYTFESSVEADRFFGLKKGSCGDKARTGWSYNNTYWFSRELKEWCPEKEKQEKIKAALRAAHKTQIEKGTYFNRPIRRGFHVPEKTKLKERLANSTRISIDLLYLDGTLYKSFDSANECDDFLGLTRGATSKVLKGKAKTLKRKYIPIKHTNTVLTD